MGIYADLATLEKIWLNATKQDRDRKIAPLRPADDAKNHRQFQFDNRTGAR